MKKSKERQTVEMLPKVVCASTHLLDKTFAMFDNGMLDMALALQITVYDNGTSRERVIFAGEFGGASRIALSPTTYALHMDVLNHKDFSYQRALNRRMMMQEGYCETDIESVWWAMVQSLRHAGIIVITQDKAVETD